MTLRDQSCLALDVRVKTETNPCVDSDTSRFDVKNSIGLSTREKFGNSFSVGSQSFPILLQREQGLVLSHFCLIFLQWSHAEVTLNRSASARRRAFINFIAGAARNVRQDGKVSRIEDSRTCRTEIISLKPL